MNLRHRSLVASTAPRTALALLLTLTIPAAASAAAKLKEKPKTEATEAATPAAAVGSIGSGMSAMSIPGLPQYVEPPNFSVDMVIHSSQGDMTMKRYRNQEQRRTDILGMEQTMTMIEVGDEKGTTYMVMPKEKRAIKQSREAMKSMADKMKNAHAAQEKTAPPPDAKVEDLGKDTVDGREVHKFRVTSDEGAVLGWVDQATGAPLHFETEMKGEKSTIDWKNYQVGAQAAKLFEVPKDYEVVDMDEMMSKMKSMGLGGGGAMGGVGAAMGGMGGMGMGGMAKGLGSSMGQSMGSQFGGALGASLGGPLGMVAGQYIGGKIGGMVGSKAADMVTPGK